MLKNVAAAWGKIGRPSYRIKSGAGSNVHIIGLFMSCKL